MDCSLTIVVGRRIIIISLLVQSTSHLFHIS